MFCMRPRGLEWPSLRTKGVKMIRSASALIVGLVLTVVCFRMAAQGDQDSVSNVHALIVGTWELVSTEEHMADGSKRPYPDVAWMPNFVGTKQQRPYTFDGELLTFSGKTTNRPGIESWAITWRKFK